MSVPGTDACATDVCAIGGRRFEIRDMRAQDMDEVLTLFCRVFGQTPGPDWFAWKYGRGGGAAVDVRDDARRLIAHYAGFPRSLLWTGRPVRAIQIGDVMVAPELRGVLTRRGPFFQACHRFFGSHVGAGRAQELAFGFPNERHLRLGVALDLYVDAGPIHALRWATHTRTVPPWWHWSELDVADARTDAEVDSAWAAMAADMRDAVIGDRSCRYIRWRFIDRPDRRYRLFRLRRRWSPWPAGIAVLRIENGSAEWLDWIGPPRAMPVAARALALEAGRAGVAALSAWASPAVAQALDGTRAEKVATAARLAVAKCSLLTPQAIAAARWWFMGGDTDFL